MINEENELKTKEKPPRTFRKQLYPRLLDVQPTTSCASSLKEYNDTMTFYPLHCRLIKPISPVIKATLPCSRFFFFFSVQKKRENGKGGGVLMCEWRLWVSLVFFLRRRRKKEKEKKVLAVQHVPIIFHTTIPPVPPSSLSLHNYTSFKKYSEEPVSISCDTYDALGLQIAKKMKPLQAVLPISRKWH